MQLKQVFHKHFNHQKNKLEDEWANSGFGLYMVSKICEELEGSFVLASGNKYIKIKKDGEIKLGETIFKGTAVKVTIQTNKISNSRQMINKIAMQGEKQAKLIRNAFKEASKLSRGIINKI